MTDPADVWRGRVQHHLDAAGRPPLGGMVDWEVFPFERDGLTPKPLGERVVPEPSRDRSPDACGTKTCSSPSCSSATNAAQSRVRSRTMSRSPVR